MIEYWRPSEPFEPPTNVPGMWAYKSATNLYEFKKVNTPHAARVEAFAHRRPLGQVYPNMHYSLPGLVLFRHLLPTRSPNTHFLLPYWQDDA